MKPDITTREDIKLIITKFYDKLLVDEKMLPFFEEIIVKNSLDHHLDVISDFWNDILFDTTSYKNNTMQKHLDKNVFISFTKEHFTIWLTYLNDTINYFYAGEKSESMKNRAASIAMVMQLKMKLFKD